MRYLTEAVLTHRNEGYRVGYSGEGVWTWSCGMMIATVPTAVVTPRGGVVDRDWCRMGNRACACTTEGSGSGSLW